MSDIRINHELLQARWPLHQEVRFLNKNFFCRNVYIRQEQSVAKNAQFFQSKMHFYFNLCGDAFKEYILFIFKGHQRSPKMWKNKKSSYSSFISSHLNKGDTALNYHNSARLSCHNPVPLTS